MAFWILIIFISIPLIEIALFIQVGGFIGLWPTIAIVIITAILGTFLIRKQGLSTLQRAQNELEKKQIPIRELFEGICLIFSGRRPLGLYLIISNKPIPIIKYLK